MAKKAPKSETPGDAMKAALEREQDVLRVAITRAHEAYSHLVDRLDPEVGVLVDRILTAPSPDQERMLKAWRDCARRDVVTHRAVDITRTAKTTVTTFGTACLAAYAKSYADAAEALLATLGLGGVAKEQRLSDASSPPASPQPSK